jgi:hypothetical protein
VKSVYHVIPFKYLFFRGELKQSDPNEYFPGSKTLVAHSAAPGAMAVGAILYTNTPEFEFDNPDPAIVPFTVSTYSSAGELGGAMVAITAPSAVNTTVFLGLEDFDGDGHPNFSEHQQQRRMQPLWQRWVWKFGHIGGD